MNTERLHVIAMAVVDDLKKTGVESLLNNLNNALQNQITQPQQSQYPQQVASNLETLYEKLNTASSNEFSPAWHLLLEELGGKYTIGNKLIPVLKNIFERNQITTTIALKEIKEIYSSINNFRTALEKIISGFQALNIGKEDLTQGECEIEILIPRKAVDNNLYSLGEELQDLENIFKVFEEIITKTCSGYKVRTISSTDFMIFLCTIPPVALVIATAMERVLAAYKNLLEIIEIQKRLSNLNTNKKIISDLKNDINTHMKSEIKKITEDIMKEYYIKQTPNRYNELVTALNNALNAMANRIDRGFHIDVRVMPVKEIESSSTENIKDLELKEQIIKIQSVTKNLQYIKTDGDPVLLLPESETEK